jgi:glycosyltransferase involved in cell wall biosynthesis
MSARPPVPELRVGLVGPLPPPSGGMANQTLQLARLLQEAGVTVHLVQNNPPCRPALVERVRGLRAGWRLLPYLWRLWRCAGQVDLLHVMANSGLAWYAFAAPALYVAALRGTPVVLNYRGGGAQAFLARRATRVRRLVERARAVLIVPSGFLARVFVHHGMPAEIVPNVVDLSRFRPRGALPGDAYGAPHLIVTRNLEDIYDVPTALRAFVRVRAAHPGARLTIAGSGPRRAALEALAAELGVGDAVRFSGRIDNQRIADLYREADLLLNPATVDNMPVSLLEAMASGVPIVSTDVGGVPFLVTHGRHALLVPARDPQAMADAALRLLGDAALAQRLRREGLAHAATFGWDRVRPRLFEVYARVQRQERIAVSAP